MAKSAAMVRIPPEDPMVTHLRLFLEELITRTVTELEGRTPAAGPKRLPARATEPSPSVTSSGFMRRSEVVEYTQYSRRQIARLIKAGYLKPSGPNHDRFRRFEVDRMMDQLAAAKGRASAQAAAANDAPVSAVDAALADILADEE